MRPVHQSHRPLKTDPCARCLRAVLETLEPLDGDRKCFRMINGVLVEMTVKDVLPPLKTNTEGLKKVGAELESQLVSKQKELDEWKVSLCSVPGAYILLFSGLACRTDPSFYESTEEAQCPGRAVNRSGWTQEAQALTLSRLCRGTPEP